MNAKPKIFVDICIALIAISLLAACGTATPMPTTGAISTPIAGTVMVKVANNPLLGNILVDGAGMTLYEYTKDTQGTSNCTGQCAQNWPPYIVPAGSTVQASSSVDTPVGDIQRPDGTRQVAVNGMPVYYFIKDKKPGDVFGQGAQKIWFVMDSQGGLVQTALPTAVPTATPVPPTLEVQAVNNPTLGNILVDDDGMTLYVFTKDAAGMSNCLGQCAVNWPPYIVDEPGTPQAGPGVSATLGTIVGDDGTPQLTINNMPVYNFSKDQKPGDVRGQGIGGFWFVLDPSGAMVKTTAPKPTGVEVQTANDPILGNILVDDDGMTLYAFTKDAAGMSNCLGQCAVNWPPYIADEALPPQAGAGVTAKLGTIVGDDGTVQLTVNNMPVYNFSKDQKPGDVRGQGIGGFWFVLDPTGKMVKTTVPKPTAVPGTLTVKSANDPKLGNILVDGDGLTLYIFTKDSPGKSVCTGQCAVNWPAYTLMEGAVLQAGPGVTAKLGTIQSDDGTLQLTINDMPVYYFSQDQNPGDVRGQGIGGFWWVLDPSGAMVKTKA